jgi:hypothetical protein
MSQKPEAGSETVLAAVLHHNCVGCLSQAEVEDGLEATDAGIILLAILRAGVSDLDSVYGDLCFFHRRVVDDAARAVAEKK